MPDLFPNPGVRQLTRVLVVLLVAVVPARAQQVAFETDLLRIESAGKVHEFEVELAETPGQRGRGLMFRTEMAADHGMLFDFEPPKVASMWMRNTYLPLDMLFIRGDGTISSIAADTTPLSDTVIRSQEPVAAVLELNAGTAANLGIRPGDRVVHPWFEG
jgi:uncharacterized membrane protein (UPF0127 family)